MGSVARGKGRPTVDPNGITPGDWRAQVRLTNKAGTVFADVGETCDRVPAASMPWLIDQGLVKPATPPGKE